MRLKKIKFNLLYWLSGFYIFIAIISIFTNIPLSPKFTGYTGVVALLITIVDFSNIAYNIEKRKGGRKRQQWSYIFKLFTQLILTAGSLFFVYWFYTADDELVTKISNYGTYAAVGVVFIGKGMEAKNTSSRVK